MARKPSDLIYGLEDSPPLLSTIILSLQHVFLLSTRFIYPVLIVEAIGGSREVAAQIISFSMIAGGVGSILQVLHKGPVGSGYLNPQGCGAAYISTSILAGKAGGVPLILGMTMIAGLFEVLLARVVYRLRQLFTAEVTGVVVCMVGISIIPVAIKNFMGIDRLDLASESAELIVAGITISVMVAISVWSKGKLRLYPLIIGLSAGSLAAFGTGIFTFADFVPLIEAPFLAIPQPGHLRWSFDLALAAPFMIAALATGLKITGELIVCQKINDAEWKRPDMRSISRGILADALGTLTAGLMGGMGQGSSSANVGFSIATSTTSRRICYAVGIILMLLAFFPKLAVIFVILPKPVKGAAIVYVACFMIVTGIQIMTSRMMDARKTFVIGFSLILGLSVDIVPGLYAHVPPMLDPIFGSSLSFATLSALILNLIFRIGIAQKETIEVEPRIEALEEITIFMENQGAAWGALRDVINRALLVAKEFLESIIATGLAKGKLNFAMKFDEFNLDIDAWYDGELVEFPKSSPLPNELLCDDKAFIKLSGFLIKTFADKVKSSCDNGRCHVHFHFDH